MSELHQIRTLRLGAHRREQVARTTIALEDALRTVSMPRLPRGAILLVRRLDLGRFPANASPQWLSRRLETRLQALQPKPVRPPHDAPAPPAVWFADRSEALAALLAASLQDAPRAWYWAGVLPGWRPGMAMRELLPRALRDAAAEPADAAGTAGIAALLDRLRKLDRLDPILEHLEPDHIAPISRSVEPTAATVPPPASAAQVAAGARPVPQYREPSEVLRPEPPSSASDPSAWTMASAAWREVLVRWVRRWGPADQRIRWLAAHALVAVHGPAAAARADQLVAHLMAPMPPSQTEPHAARTGRPISRSAARRSGAPERVPRPGASTTEAVEAPPEPEPTRGAVQPRPHEAFHDARLDALPPTEPDWQPGHVGGLLLLLPAIARLEIAEADPEGDLCLHLLHRIADRLKIRNDDALRQALPKPLPRDGPWLFVPPDAWRDLLRLPSRLDLGREEDLLAACQLALARYLRRYAKMSPRRLIRRPALVHATSTHIDLCFDARWVELEVRLAGLDLDPGWVPWLGRVVSFHYDYEGRS